MTVYNCLQHFTDTLKKETLIKSRFPKKLKERETGIEPATPSLARRCSTAEPLAHLLSVLTDK